MPARLPDWLTLLSIAAIAAIAAIWLAAACGGSSPPPAPTSVATPGAANLDPAEAPNARAAEKHAMRGTIEAKAVSKLTPALAALVREQQWFQEPVEGSLALAEAILGCEKAARARGETSVPDVLSFASEQEWYRDGLDERELTALAGLFDAYARSLADINAPPIGPILSSTIEYGLFDALELPETGSIVLLVSTLDRALGEQALALAREAMPAIERIVGAFPYSFLHIEVTPDLPVTILGLSYNEFVAIRSDSVESPVILHELSHSTLYGIFPLWFEEGMAHFLQYYQTGSLADGEADYNADLRLLARDSRLDLRPRASYSARDAYAERAQGFLFIKALYDVEGIEGLSTTVRALRKRTFSDQELLRALVQEAPTEQQALVSQLMCRGVLGATRDYCAAR